MIFEQHYAKDDKGSQRGYWNSSSQLINFLDVNFRRDKTLSKTSEIAALQPAGYAGTLAHREDFQVGDNTFGPCDFCPAGTFSDHHASSVCTPCPKGFFSSALGSTECVPCPQTRQPLRCDPPSVGCEPGKYSHDGLECTKCPAGFYCPGWTELIVKSKSRVQVARGLLIRVVLL